MKTSSHLISLRNWLRGFSRAQLGLTWGIGGLIFAAALLGQRQAEANWQARVNARRESRDGFVQEIARLQAERDSVLAVLRQRDSVRNQFWLKGGPAPPPLDAFEQGRDSLRFMLIRSTNERIPRLDDLASAADTEFRLERAQGPSISAMAASWAGLAILAIMLVLTGLSVSGEVAQEAEARQSAFVAVPRVYCEHSAMSRTVRRLQHDGSLELCHFPYDPDSRSGKLPQRPVPSGATINDLNMPIAELPGTIGDYASSPKFSDILAIIGSEHRRDALHLDSAYKSGCAAFLTRDSDILNHRVPLQHLLELQILNPDVDEASIIALAAPAAV